jgi:hypothetical protein
MNILDTVVDQVGDAHHDLDVLIKTEEKAFSARHFAELQLLEVQMADASNRFRAILARLPEHYWETEIVKGERPPTKTVVAIIDPTHF